MSIATKIWRVNGSKLAELQPASLDSEKQLENWLEADQALLGERLLIVGRQVRTAYGTVIDLLAIDATGTVCVIELKRDMTPRQATAQLLEYGSWLSTLSVAEFEEISNSDNDIALAIRFKEHFGSEMPDFDPRSHRLLLVAPSLDDTSERIITYLSSSYGVNINSVSFNVFADQGGTILARSWLIDPADVARSADPGISAGVEWTGFWYVNVGEQPEAYATGVNRSWDDCVKYGMISAGQGRRWSAQLEKLKVGDKIFAYLNKHGYVGYGLVTSAAVKASEFVPVAETLPISQLPVKGSALKNNPNDPELADYVVGIDWKNTLSADAALYKKGLFAKQFVVCKLYDTGTRDFLVQGFQLSEG